jgi:hypothetical protein
MASTLYENVAGIYTQVSQPQCHNGQGPYILAITKKDDSFEFHCFEIMDAETFLADPETTSANFIETEFLFTVADTLDLHEIENTGQYFVICLCKVIPDLPACRYKVRELYAIKPELVANLLFLSAPGILFPATDVVNIPDFLN